MQMTLVAMCLVAIAMMACGPSAMPTVSESYASPEQAREPNPSLLLDEESAISILQTFLQDCVLSWDGAYAGQIRKARADHFRARDFSRSMGTVIPTSTPLSPADYQLPPSAQEKKSWLTDLASGTTGAIVWSAQYHGVTELGRTETEAETWVVIGPGLERAKSQLSTHGRWKVYAGHRRAYYLDPSARLALEEYDRYDSCP